MDELILKSYLDKIKEEYKFINLFKQSDILNKCMIILYFLLASLFVIMIILGCFIKGLLAYACIPLFLLVVPASIMIILMNRTTYRPAFLLRKFKIYVTISIDFQKE